MSKFKSLIAKVADGHSLTTDEARQAFDIMMSGEATAAQIAGLLMAMRVRGESVDELRGAVETMRAKMTRVTAPADAVDIVGTGGDNSGTYNVSTCAAIIAAGAGMKVAKHGNRSLSSKSGAADALSALGINIEIGPDTIAECISKAGLGFMFAPVHHSAMRYIGPTRVELGTRTLFNLLGPLSNPAGVKRQVIGVFSAHWLMPIAEVLRDLGSEHVWVIHGDGLDELTTAGETQVVELKDGTIKRFSVSPNDAGLETVSIEALKGGDPEHNAAALRCVLNGERGAYRDIACLNAAAGLIVGGLANNVREGVDLAARAIDTGQALAVLDRLVQVSNG